MKEFFCISVINGWQTAFKDENGATWAFGPAFNKVNDLWAWQKNNLPKE
jgi:hypothetical protein